ncbi:hypothetical protein VTK56DRAFT_9102 [Thermocarpiscus australiensis]
MALWPFRRKSRRKRGRAGTIDEESGGGTARAVLPPRSQTVPDATISAVGIAPERQATKKQRAEPNKLQRRPRAYSFSPDRRDSLLVGRRKSTRTRPETTILLSGAEATAPWTRDNNDRTIVDSGTGAVNDEMLRRAPTLHNKRDGDHLPRKKSSKKRRKDDREREAEIKAMSSFVPLRRAVEDWTAGRPMKRESRRIKTGFGVGFKGAEWERYNRSSDISLPPLESINSALSSDSDYISYKVSPLEVLAPRPRLRCTTHLRSGTPVSDGPGLFRRPSQQKSKLSGPIPEATLRAHKRIDDLADDLSASDLRELMERDQRRRERRRQREQEKLAQRLARRAEKQKTAEAEAQKDGRESPPNLERGVLGRESVGLGIDPASAVVTSSRIRDSDEQPKEHGELAEVDHTEVLNNNPRLHPLTSFRRIDSISPQTPGPPLQIKEPRVPAVASSGLKGSLRRKLSRSKSPQESETRTEQSEPQPKGSETSSSRGPRSWTSFFRWSNSNYRNKRDSGGPPSFSNTSRDSMLATQGPAPPINFAPRHLSSGPPKRTMSRFREDLPELPISPPASRLQSPDAETIPAIHPVVEASPEPRRTTEEAGGASSGFEARYDGPVSEQRSVEAIRQTPSTFSHPEEPGVSPESQAMSLASVDSEGSWFSGKLLNKRSSGIMQHASGLRLRRQTPDWDHEPPERQDNANEDTSITEDDYLSRLARSHGDQSGWNRKSTGEARPSSDWEGEAHWGSVREQHPTVVHSHAVDRMKSREGLLKSFGEEGEETLETADPTDDSDAGVDGKQPVEGLQRATNIDLGKAQARRFSAGSAQCVTPRSSVDARQASMLPTAEGS